MIESLWSWAGPAIVGGLILFPIVRWTMKFLSRAGVARWREIHWQDNDAWAKARGITLTKSALQGSDDHPGGSA